MQGRQITLLLIEDSDDDAFLLLHQLKKHGFEADCVRVETEDEMRDALTTKAWDIVISDHSLPEFSSIGALHTLQSYNSDIPMIILSGNIDQRVAVDCMRLGARDYIMKDDVSRLIPAIEREIQAYEIRKDKHRAEAEIKHMAFHDSLTGLVNRAEFEKRLQHALISAKSKKTTHALLYMDLDHFKVVNDTCGHAAGDELLRQLSSCLAMNIRTRDTLARVGGDEFAVLLESCSLKHATKIAEDIKEAVKNFQFGWHEKMFRIGISIGLLSINENSGTHSELLSSADFACYTAKDKGRNTIQVYHADDAEMTRRREESNWASRIDTAIENDQFILYQQLIQPAKSDTDLYPHHEVLLRLNHKGKIITPDVFIPAAERYLRMVAVDKWVIKHALKQLTTLQTSDPAYNMAINLSGQSLNEKNLFNYIKHQLNEHGINPESVCFEITETAAIANFQNALNFFTLIKDLGCTLSLDDFGSGLSSFSYLKNMPIDYLKIDGGFVKNILHDPMDRAIVESINEIGHKAGVKTIAEFVENTDIRDALIDIGVDYLQGFGIHKPEPL